MFQCMLAVLLVLHPVRVFSTQLEYPLSKPNCPNQCGNVSVPFPFGIGKGCFLDEWYEIVCINNKVPRFSKVDLEVINISTAISSFYSENTLIVMYPIVYSPMSCTHAEIRDPLNFAGSPFAFSGQYNIFVVVGCDNTAIMRSSEDPSFVGCQTKCTGNNTSQYNGCSGYDCCYSEISGGFQNYNVHFQNTNSRDHECQFAFLVNNSWFNNLTDLYELRRANMKVPVVLRWGIINVSHVTSSLGLVVGNQYRYGHSTSECSTVTYINQTIEIIMCKCSSGYHGNPLLPYGCQDINECELHDQKYKCPYTCKNVPGSYKCVRNRTPMFLAIGFSSSFGSLALIFVSWWIYKVMKKRREDKLKDKFFKRNGGLILQQQLSSPGSSVEKGKLFTKKQLEKATDNFNMDRILGQGGQGTVYKGMLTDGRIVAIKKSIMIDEDYVEQFINEVVILSQTNHRNIVKILGCCLESEVPLLVYEFIPNGTLYRYLHDPNEDFPLSWKVRLKIATEIASALSYLHSSASIPIYHRDIKTTNILLDDQYRAKIADFGTSKSVTLDQTHVTTLVQGTFGYLDPEYFQSSQFTDKSDVYSFGVVLVELLTRQKPVSSTRASEGRNLAMYFIISMEENRLFDIVDAQVLAHGGEEEITAVANLAKRCLNLKGRKRPMMKEVVMELEGIQNRVIPNLQQEQETDEQFEIETLKGSDAFLTSTGFEVNADTMTISDIHPLLLTDSL